MKDRCIIVSVVLAENTTIVSESVVKDPIVSIPHCSQELGLSSGALWLILNLDLHLHPYKVHLTQQLKLANHSHCRRYEEWVLEQQKVDGNFSKKLWSAMKHISHSVGSYLVS